MSVVVSLPRRLDTATVPDVTVQLIEALHHDTMTLDARQTVHIGALGAQMLLSAQCTMQASGGTFRIIASNKRVREQLTVMGLPQLPTSEIDE
ncbi:MAG: STAS domain-containing protein [Pseudomonadota bacterium]